MTYRATFDPGVGNDETQGFTVNGTWLNTASQDLFRCDDATEDAAVWTDITGGAPHTHAHADTTGRTADDHHNQQHALGGADHTGDIGDLDGYTKSEVDVLVDATLKAPEAFAPSGTYPVTYEGNAVQRGDSFRITGAGTMGAVTVNVEDLLIALIDTPAQTDGNWMVAESNRDQATETVKGVAEIATQAVADAGTDDANIITAKKMAAAPVNAHTHAHSDTTGQGADDHHAEDHAARHQNGGADELNVGGLSGLLADAQTPASHVHSAADLTSGTLDDARVAESSVTQHEAAIDHDALAGFEIGEHRVIDDAGTSTTGLWSSDKIDAEFSTLLAGSIRKPGVDTSTHGLGNIALTGEQTLNGVTTSASLVLVTEQTLPEDNGFYVTASGAWARASFADEDSEVTNGNLTDVLNTDSTKFGYKYLLVTPDPIVVGTTGQAWEEHRSIDFGTVGGTATEGNDSRVPTQDENDALVGTSGTASSANKYVTDADPRNSDARTPAAHTILSHDTDATGAELTALTDGSEVNGLHVHAPAQLFPWTFSTSTSAGDPGSGRVRMDSGTQSAVTKLYFSEDDSDGFQFNNFFGNLVVGEEICGQQSDDSSRTVVFSISGAPVDEDGWWTIPVTFVSSDGALFTNNKATRWLIKMRF